MTNAQSGPLIGPNEHGPGPFLVENLAATAGAPLGGPLGRPLAAFSGTLGL